MNETGEFEKKQRSSNLTLTSLLTLTSIRRARASSLFSLHLLRRRPIYPWQPRIQQAQIHAQLRPMMHGMA